MTPTFKPGDIYKHWEIVRFAGAGLHGEVYRVRQRFTGASHALKLMHLESAANWGTLHRALTTGVASFKISHRNVIEIEDLACEPDGRFWILMEWLDGCSIHELLTRQCMRLSVPLSLHVLIEVCWGLHAAHERGLIHRDIKPDNVWRTADGTIKILDFSLAKFVEDEAQTTIRINGTGLGTHAYLAPEALKAGAPVDARVDVYAVGIMTWQAIAGRHPFQAVLRTTSELIRHQLYVEPEPLSLVAGLPAYVDAFFARALAKNPDHRFQTVAEMARSAMALRDRLLADVEAGEIDLEIPHGEPRLPEHEPGLRAEYAGPRTAPGRRAEPPLPSKRVVVPGQRPPAKTAPMAAVPAAPATALASTLPLQPPTVSLQATLPMVPAPGAGTSARAAGPTLVSAAPTAAAHPLPSPPSGVPSPGTSPAVPGAESLWSGATAAPSRTSDPASRTRETAPAVERAALRSPRRPRARIVIAALTLLSASVASLVTWGWRRHEPPRVVASASSSVGAAPAPPPSVPPAASAAPSGSPLAPVKAVLPEPEPPATPTASASASAVPRRRSPAAQPRTPEPVPPLAPPPAPPTARGRLFGTEN